MTYMDLSHTAPKIRNMKEMLQKTVTLMGFIKYGKWRRSLSRHPEGGYPTLPAPVNVRIAMPAHLWDEWGGVWGCLIMLS